MKTFAQSLLAFWRQLGINQRVSLVVAVLAVSVVISLLYVWSQRPDYQLLYGRLGDKDLTAIVSSLQAQGVPHRVEAGSVFVAANQVHRLRMELAGKGIPSGDGVGFEIFDRGQFGLSDFVQRTNYNRALQGELARTISQLNGVSHARVMIVQPESRLLITDQGVKPTASVFIEMSSSRMESEAVNAIRHLVANAVQGLTADDVAVVDQRGRVLSAELKSDPVLGSATGLIRHRQQVEEYLAAKVEGMLVPVVGVGNAIVRVSAEIDHEAATLTEERFDPESAVVRSQVNTEDSTNSTETRRGGVVGAGANLPESANVATTEASPVVTNAQVRRNNTINFEINRSTTSVRRNPGTIKSLSAAVFIASRPPGSDGVNMSRSPEELDALRRIVINALGLRLSSGQNADDLVTLHEVPFQQETYAPELFEVGVFDRVQSWVDTGRHYTAVLIAIVALLVFWRMLRATRPEAVPVDLLHARPETSSNGMTHFTPEMLNELIRQKPANIGTALREWVTEKRN
jgi:flagellar M-ring protein FliF